MNNVANPLFWLLVLFKLTNVQCEQDSNSYFTKGAHNSMYWREASNVLEDVSYFSKLYVSFHNCALSPSSIDDGNCAAQTDDHYWYMGSTECFRANAAYSLYGILDGQEDIGCNRKTFINSFFTTQGVEVFTQAIANAGVSFTSNDNAENDYPGGYSSRCSSEANDDYNDDDSVSHNQKYGSRYSSYGLGCNRKSFAMKQFRGPFCNIHEAIKTIDRALDFNNDLKQSSCIPIYVNNGEDNNNNNNNKNNNNNNNVNNLLSYSSSCNVRKFKGSCPDPFGKLAAYAIADARAVAFAKHPVLESIKIAASWIYLSTGILLLLFSLSVFLRRRRRIRRKFRVENGTWIWSHRDEKSSSSPSSNLSLGSETKATSVSSKRSNTSRSSRRLFRILNRN